MLDAQNEVTAFFSCSIRDGDAALVNKTAKILSSRGIMLKTIGRNVGMVAPSDDAIKRLMNECDCLIGLATKRFDAVETGTLNVIGLTLPYLLYEASMAFQRGMPILIIKTDEVTLSGVLSQNIYLTVRPTLSASGGVIFKNKELFESTLSDLKDRAKNSEILKKLKR